MLLAALPLACARTPSRATPRSALDAYAQAVADGRYRDAYASLSAETRAHLSFEAFVETLTDNPEEMRELLRAARTSQNEAEVRATITGVDGQTLELVYEDGGWKIEESAVNLYSQETPRAALESFLAAFDRKRYDVLLRFVPRAHLEGMDEKVLRSAWEGEQKAEMEAIIEGVRAALPNTEIELLGDRAALTYAGGGTVEMVLERGVWKIEDFR